MRTPASLLADRWRPSAQVVQRAALAALVMSVVIVVTGGAVRLTGSGLGCKTWPTCTGESITPTPALGIHGVIEFTNRMLTYVLCAAVAWVTLAARCHRPWLRSVSRLGWAQFWAVMSNAVIGGITVLTHLNPYVVGLHMVSATGLVWVATLTWERSKEGDGPIRSLVSRPVQQLANVAVVATVLLVLAGILVTGAGHHPGDSSDVPRIGFSYDRLAQLHTDVAFGLIGISLALIFVLAAVQAPRAAIVRSRELFAMLALQAVIGFVQYFTDVPVILVGLHMLGSALIVIAAVRIPLALRVREEQPAPVLPEPVLPEPQPATV